MPVYPVTVETPKLAGRLEGEGAEQGVNVPFEDLLIAATALELGFSFVTGNVRHFERILGITVLPAWGPRVLQKKPRYRGVANQ
jgi:predicted nucleic acid-binding protein